MGCWNCRDVINELGRRLGCYVTDQEIWLSYDQDNQIKPEKTGEK